MEAVKKHFPYQIFTINMYAHLSPLYTIVTIAPFVKWLVDFMMCQLNSIDGQKYIIVVVNYFTN